MLAEGEPQPQKIKLVFDGITSTPLLHFPIILQRKSQLSLVFQIRMVDGISWHWVAISPSTPDYQQVRSTANFVRIKTQIDGISSSTLHFRSPYTNYLPLTIRLIPVNSWAYLKRGFLNV